MQSKYRERKETKAREDALSALRKWLDDAKHFYSISSCSIRSYVHGCNTCLQVVSYRERLRILFVSVTKILASSIHRIGHGVEYMCFLRELALCILGKPDSIQEAKRCAKTRDMLLRTYEKSSEIYIVTLRGPNSGIASFDV